MIYNSNEAARVSIPVLLVATIAWVLLIAGPSGITASAHCAAMDILSSTFPASLNISQAIYVSLPLIFGWMLMLAAMMLPALTQPVYHVYLRSFAHRRLRSIACFLAGYGAIWIAAGVVLLPIEVAARVLAPQSYLPAIVIFLVAMVWQCSPIKQRSLNRCHLHTELAAFGVAADLSALRFGVTHGVWCVCSCWAWMLSAMLLPNGHLVAMAAVTILLVCERMEKPQPLAWRVRGLGRTTRFLIFQMRLCLRMSFASAPSFSD